MHFLRLVPLTLVLLAADSSFAQDWREYVSRDEFFMVQFPAEPRIETAEYRAASGALLPAKIYSATYGPRLYSVTVVHYMNAQPADIDNAMEHGVNIMRNTREAQVTFDSRMDGDGYPGHTVYLDFPDRSRTAASVHWHEGRLYILAAWAPADMAPPIQFPQTLYILDENGHRVSYEIVDGERVRIGDCAFCPETGNLPGQQTP